MISEKTKDFSGGLPIVQLHGDVEENFYQLGLNDRPIFAQSEKHIRSLVKTPWPGLDSAIFTLAAPILARLIKHKAFHKKVAAYAEGLSRREEEVALLQILPELMSFATKWRPKLPLPPLGCSSFFARLKGENSPTHLRLLDFALWDTYEGHERLMQTSYHGTKAVSFSTVGLPYPSLTTLTEHGLSFALHQKITSFFDDKGTPIFELLFQLIHQCTTLEEVLSCLKDMRSLTAWGILILDRQGRYLAYDIYGREKVRRRG